MKIAMIGSGYVGLTTGSCLAKLGHEVTCVDNNEEKINYLNAGKIPIFEPGLGELVRENVLRKKLFFSTDIKAAVNWADVVFIAVGTPPKANGEADLSVVENVSREIAHAIGKYTVVVEKSTVPVETGEKISRAIKSEGVKNALFDVVSNPEFLREGSAIKDFLEPDRIVIGADSEKARKIMKEVYAGINAPIVFTDIRSAEIIKHASNSFLATKISFINAISRICDLSGADVEQVALGMGLDKRIGKEFLHAGIGYGGSCFPKDVSAFIKISEKNGYDFRLLKEVEKINSSQLGFFLKKIHDGLWNLSGKKIAVLGLSFKPGTDDMREAPSVKVIEFLLSEGASVTAFDPVAVQSAKKFFPKARFAESALGAVEDADGVVFMTEWKEFAEIDLVSMKKRMKHPLVFDARNIFDPAKMKQLGFSYHCVGRSSMESEQH